jgi:hypothetical protein
VIALVGKPVASWASPRAQVLGTVSFKKIGSRHSNILAQEDSCRNLTQKVSCCVLRLEEGEAVTARELEGGISQLLVDVLDVSQIDHL